MIFCFDFSARKSERDGCSCRPQGDQNWQECPDLQPGSLRPPVHSLYPLHLHGCCQQILELCPLNPLLQVILKEREIFGLELDIRFCRFIKTFPCVAVYMSSLTNMAIAMDRYRFIVKSQSLQVSTVGAALLYPVIVIISLLLAFPIAYKSKLVPIKQLLVSLAMMP